MRVGYVALIGMASLLLASATPQAGEANSIWLKQVSPAGSLDGNDLLADQSGASNSLITGIDSDRIDPLAAPLMQQIGADPAIAMQRGEGNKATLTITGNGGKLELLQSSNPLMPFAPGDAAGNNTAIATAADGSQGTIVQIGARNAAGLDLLAGASGLITQVGTGLSSNLDVDVGGSAVVTQIGDNSDTGTLKVAPGATLEYTQIGDNLETIGMQSVQIVNSSNPGAISITQTAW